MMYHGYGMGGGGWILLSLLTLALVALVVVAVLAAIRPLPRGGRVQSALPEPAEQVLADRLARGDIDSEEYEQRMRTLRNSRQ